jgi:PleD family two-component response regulator
MLVLDQMMPGLLGTDLLKAIRSIPAIAHVPAIFDSASAAGEVEAPRPGALDRLVKGQISWEDLIARIINVYHSRRPPRSLAPYC